MNIELVWKDSKTTENCVTVRRFLTPALAEMWYNKNVRNATMAYMRKFAGFEVIRYKTLKEE